VEPLGELLRVFACFGLRAWPRSILRSIAAVAGCRFGGVSPQGARTQSGVRRCQRPPRPLQPQWFPCSSATSGIILRMSLDSPDGQAKSYHDLPTAQSLVRLRLLTEDAVRRADDASEAGRHQALISLDGACEHALWLAARQAGIRLRGDQRAGVPALHRAVVEQRREWVLRGWSGVNQLHEARNTAQHAGVAPDREQFPGWRDAAVAFIDSLCREAFDTPLKDIVLASAVRDLELRAMLTEAEMSVASDTHQSFAASTMAFTAARDRWREQRVAAVSAPIAGGFELILASEESQAINELTGAVQSLENLLEMQPFAGDLSEYVWFRRALGERATAGWEPTENDARRALIFVAGWVVRWEIFDLGYPDDEWAAHREGIEPPQHGDGTTVTINGAQADLIPEATGQPARTVLYLQLANVPARGRPPWEPILLQAVADELRKINTEQERQVFIRAFWHYSGVLAPFSALRSG
jgi:hypothetical protein